MAVEAARAKMADGDAVAEIDGLRFASMWLVDYSFGDTMGTGVGGELGMAFPMTDLTFGGEAIVAKAGFTFELGVEDALAG